MQDLKSKAGFKMTVMNWSTGVVILTKTKWNNTLSSRKPNTGRATNLSEL